MSSSRHKNVREPSEIEAWKTMMDSMVQFISASTKLMKTITNRAETTPSKDSIKCEVECIMCPSGLPKQCGVCAAAVAVSGQGDKPRKTSVDKEVKQNGEPPKKIGKESEKEDKEKGGESPKEEGGEPSKEEGEESQKGEGEESQKEEDGEPKKEEGEKSQKEEDGETKKEEGEETKKEEGEESQKEEGEESQKEGGKESEKEEGEESQKEEGGETSTEEGGKDKKAEADTDPDSTAEETEKPSKTDIPQEGGDKKNLCVCAEIREIKKEASKAGVEVKKKREFIYSKITV